MSGSEFNNYELQACRRLLCLDVSDAAELIGRVSNRTWQYWESGRSRVPEDVETEMYGLLSLRNEVIEAVLDELSEGIGAIRWYHTFDAFSGDFPNENKVMWRLHQSVCAHLFTTEGGDVTLLADAPLQKQSYLYQFFDRSTPEQREHAEQERIFSEQASR